MRKVGCFIVGSVLIFGAAGLVEDLQAQQKGGGGGGGGNPLTLLTNKDVRKELDLTDEQAAKLNVEVQAAIAKVLSEKQAKRYRQIQVQQQGINAFKDDAVQKQLNLNADQKKTIGEVLETAAKELAELAPKGGIGFGKGKGGGTGEKSAKVRTEAREKIMGTLTKAQRQTWTEMNGEEFKFTPFGFGGGTKGKTDPKKEAPKDK